MGLTSFRLRRQMIKHELKVHVFSTLLWWGLFAVIVGASTLATARPLPVRLLVGALPLIAILEGVFFLGSILRG